MTNYNNNQKRKKKFGRFYHILLYRNQNLLQTDTELCNSVKFNAFRFALLRLIILKTFGRSKHLEVMRMILEDNYVSENFIEVLLEILECYEEARGPL